MAMRSQRLASAWNPALAQLAQLSKKPTPPQRRSALQQLWHSQAFLETPRHFALAINAFGRERRWQDALHLLAQMPQRSLGPCMFSHSAAVSACARASAWPAAMGLICDAGTEPDLIAVTSALTACQKASRWQEALALQAEAQRRALQLDIVALNSVISSCGKGSAWAAALALLQFADSQRLKPGLVTWSSAVSACERGQQWQRALRLFAQAKEQGVDAILLGAAISACEKGRQWQVALGLLRAAPAWGCRADTVAVNAALSACGKSSEWQKALELLRAPDAVSFDAALDAVALASEWPKVLVLLQDMEQHGFRRSEFSYVSSLSALSSSRQWQRAMVLWEELEKGGSANVLLRLAGVEAFGDHCWRWALQLAHDGDLDLQRGVLRALLRASRLEEALALYRDLEEQGAFQPWLSECELDLHGMCLEVAFLASLSALLSRALSPRPLLLVVGLGRGSGTGGPVLATQLPQLLALGVALPSNPGRLLVTAADIAGWGSEALRL
ncbi:unnamed protein product [Effrenium voratum]|uniref:Pentatricopeptide repeat-containing protein, chloroplastic n=2 Tax=Effrenium voratum TaxID=2562239 RepID=A0AA36J4M8_9DINO|nr:unnamed protein product [Effrenium voratum]CAJ1398454.1 unnamed protein product [Effrenium voratum]